MFLPLFDHLPFISPDAGHDLAGPQLYGNDPGVYHNCLEDPDSPVFDSSPHIWTHSEPVDISPDQPYSCYPLPCAADGSHSQSLGFIGGVGIDGGNGNATCIYSSCDDHDTYGISGSGWQGPGNGEESGDLWNPAVKTGSGMSVSKALAVAPMAAIPEEERAEKEDTETVSRPSPSHMLLMGHAMLFGALSSLADKDVLAGKASFSDTFKAKSQDAAAAITPVGAYVLREKVFKQ